MSASERLKAAGLAAELLEEMGFVSVARLRDGVVSLECWERASARPRMVTHVVDEDGMTPEALAASCVSALEGGPPSDAS